MNSLGILVEEEDDVQLGATDSISPTVSLLPPLPNSFSEDEESLDDEDDELGERGSDETNSLTSWDTTAKHKKSLSLTISSTQSSPALRQQQHQNAVFQFPALKSPVSLHSHRNASVSSQMSEETAQDDTAATDPRPSMRRHKSGFSSMASISSTSSVPQGTLGTPGGVLDSPVINVTERFNTSPILPGNFDEGVDGDVCFDADMLKGMDRRQLEELLQLWITKKQEEQNGFDIALMRMGQSGWSSKQDLIELQKKKNSSLENWNSRLLKLQELLK